MLRSLHWMRSLRSRAYCRVFNSARQTFINKRLSDHSQMSPKYHRCHPKPLTWTFSKIRNIAIIFDEAGCRGFIELKESILSCENAIITNGFNRSVVENSEPGWVPWEWKRREATHRLISKSRLTLSTNSKSMRHKIIIDDPFQDFNICKTVSVRGP
jgi:hypothetical protein